MYYGKRDYCHPRYYGSTPDRLYLGNGKGGFTDVSASSGIRAHPGKGMGRQWPISMATDGWISSSPTTTQPIGGGLGGWLLSLYGYAPNAVQSAHALTGIRMTASVFSAIPFFLRAICLFFYQIDTATSG